MWWVKTFNEHGGYDSMTGAWVIHREHSSPVKGPERIVIDLDDYGQPHCHYEVRPKAAEDFADFVLDALNSVAASG